MGNHQRFTRNLEIRKPARKEVGKGTAKISISKLISIFVFISYSFSQSSQFEFDFTIRGDSFVSYAIPPPFPRMYSSPTRESTFRDSLPKTDRPTDRLTSPSSCFSPSFRPTPRAKPSSLPTWRRRSSPQGRGRAEKESLEG